MIRLRSMPAMDTREFGLVPCFVTVGAGEDILLKMISISESRNCIVLVTGALGALSFVSLHHGNDIYTYEGDIQVLSLHGFVFPTDSNHQLPNEWSLTMTMTCGVFPIVGGRIAGSIETASETSVMAWLLPRYAPLYRPSELAEWTAIGLPEETISNESATSVFEFYGETSSDESETSAEEFPGERSSDESATS